MPKLKTSERERQNRTLLAIIESDIQMDTVDAHCTELQHGCRFRICTRDKDHEQTRERGSGAD